MKRMLIVLCIASTAWAGQPMHEYSVLLNRVDPRAGPSATLRVTVQAPDSTTAKRMAEAKAPGYKASTSPRRLPDKK